MKITYVVTRSDMHLAWRVIDEKCSYDAVVAYCFTQSDAEKVATALNRIEADNHRGE